MSYTIKTQTNCRMCGSPDLAQFLDLGMQPLANSLVKKENLNKPEDRYPLRVLFCRNCNLAQLGEVVNPEIMFRDYIYFSAEMPKVSAHWRSYAEDIVRRFIKGSTDSIVELGSNDGVLLRAFKDLGYGALGIDPALNIARIANEQGLETWPEFFSERLAGGILAKRGPAKVIIGNNVVAHIDDHGDLMRGVRTLLAQNGVFVFEAPYLVDMFENLTFDTIYHEHLSYFAVRPIMRWLAGYGMEVFDVKQFTVQGNSVRVFASRPGAYLRSQSVNELINKESELGLDKFESYEKLADQVLNLKNKIRNIVLEFKGRGKSIAAYGAPAKGNTLLNYFGFGRDVIEYATEELPSKIGLYTPGAHIPIIDVKEARKNPPDYFLMLAWNYRDAILEKEREFRNNVGKFIIPIGKAEII